MCLFSYQVFCLQPSLFLHPNTNASSIKLLKIGAVVFKLDFGIISILRLKEVAKAGAIIARNLNTKVAHEFLSIFTP